MTGPVGLAGLVFQVAIGGTLIAGARRRDGAVIVNAVVALGAALVPTVLGSALGTDGVAGVRSVLSLWLGLAGFLHCLGMLGWYESVPWWDHVTHVVSATLVAALVYAGLLAGGRQSPVVATLTVGGTTLLATLAAGVFWELVELFARDLGERFGVDPVLVYYGWRDTVFDLGFDVFGAAVVVALDVRLFVPLAERFPAATDALLLGGASVVVVGILVLSAVVWLSDESSLPAPSDDASDGPEASPTQIQQPEEGDGETDD
ncbi:MAG: hypothetical protein ABEI80_02405 [Haloplanus sp.]